MVDKGGKTTKYIKARMKELEKPKIATANEVLETFTSILRQETVEEVTELNPVTGEFVTIDKKPNISEVIKAGSELMKRYPDAKTAEKLSLEIKKLRSETEQTEDAETLASDRMSKLEEVLGEIAEESNKDSE